MSTSMILCSNYAASRTRSRLRQQRVALRLYPLILSCLVYVEGDYAASSSKTSSVWRDLLGFSVSSSSVFIV